MYLNAPPRQGFALGYGGLPPAKMAEALKRLRRYLEAETRR